MSTTRGSTRGWEWRTPRGTERVGPGAEGSFPVDTGTRRCRPAMIGQGLGTQITLRLGRSGLWEGKQAAFRVTGGTAWRKKGRALCSPHCAGRGLGHHGRLLRAGLEAEETPPWWGPALPHIVRVGVTGRVCVQLVPNILHTRLGSLDPFSIRDRGALRKLTTRVPPRSQPSQSQGWGSGGRLGSGKGLEERAGGSRLAGGWGGSPSRKTPPPAKFPRAQVKVWSE